MATATIYADSGDGTVRNVATGSTSGTWTTLRNASTGTSVNNGGASIWVAYADDRSGDSDQYIFRSFFSFDLSSIPAGATITAVDFKLYGVAGGGSDAGGSLAPYSGSQASTTTLATSDYSQVGSTAYATGINFSSWSTAGYNTFSLNSTGIAAMQSAIGSTIKLSVRSSFDAADSKPTANQWSGALANTTEQSGTANDPHVSITYGFVKTFTADAIVAASATKTFTADALINPGPLLDTFDSSIGANWTLDVTGGGTQLAATVSSGRIVSNSSTYSSYWWNARAFAADQACFIDIPTRSGNVETQVYARLATPGTSGYDGYAVYLGPTGGGIYRFDNGTPTQLGVAINPTLSTTEGIGIVCSGSTLEFWAKTSGAWTLQGSRTDTTYSGGGYIGWLVKDTTQTARWDNVYGGSPVTTTTATVTADAIVELPTSRETFTADAVIKATSSQTFTADALVRERATKTFTADGVVNGTSYTTAGTFTTRSAYAAPVVVEDGGSGTPSNAYTFGVKLSNGNLRQYYSNAPGIAWRDSTDKGATWGSESTLSIWSGLTSSQGGGFTMIRRGASGRLHAAVSLYEFFGNYPDGYPDGGGWIIKYTPYYSYSDNDGTTWSTPEAVAYSGYGGVPMDVTELSNGEVLLAWYGNGADPGAGPYTSNVPYPDCKVSRRTSGGSWSVVGTMGTHAGMGYYCVEPAIDVIHDGTTYGKLVGHFHTEDGPPQTMWITTSSDGGVTWSTPVSTGTGYNRGSLCVTPDADVIFTYYTGALGVYRVSQDNGATWATAVSVIAGSSQPSAGGTGGYVANKWVTPYPIDSAGVSPNLGIAWGSGYDDSHGSSYFRSYSRGATSPSVYVQRTAPLTADSVIAATGSAAQTTTFTADALIVAPAYSKSYTADAVVKGFGLTKAYTTDGVVVDSASQSTALSWFFRRRRSSMSLPTKTYTSVQEKGTTRTATWTSPTFKSETEAGILVVLDVTAASGTGGLTLRINAHDLAGSVAVPLNSAPTAVTSTGTYSYAVYPFGAISGALTQSTSGYLPRQFSISVTHADSSSYTYSIGYCLLP